MNISFHGAAQTVTGSKHLIHLNNGKKILLDCGLFQGMGEETDEMNATFGFDPKEITYVLLSHAHIDHSGLLPKLVKDGFKGPIYTTPGTIDLVKLLLLDSAHIQQSDVVYLNKKRAKDKLPPLKPLYTLKDAMQVFEQLTPLEYDLELNIDENITIQFKDAGHILGSASVHVSIQEDNKKTSILFSGDVGRYKNIMLKSPQPFAQADYILLESTYGNTLHENFENSDEALLKHITETCIDKKGKLIIPSFSVGRTQELLYALNKLELEKRLPNIDYYVDSPLSVQSTEVVKKHTSYFNEKVQELLKSDTDIFNFKGLNYVTTLEDSKALNLNNKPMVIISSSGMADAGRIKHHIANNIENSQSTILLVGYCEPNSLGGKLLAKEHQVRIFRKEYFVKADIRSIRSMSAHGDYNDLIEFIACQDKNTLKKIFLVHGELNVQKEFKEKLESKGIKQVEIPKMHQTVEL
jgi:metallo-beta-lactamase family protein